jgi:hypothetical protein
MASVAAPLGDSSTATMPIRKPSCCVPSDTVYAVVFHLTLLYRLTLSRVNKVSQQFEIVQYHAIIQRPKSSSVAIHWFSVVAVSAAIIVSHSLR